MFGGLKMKVKTFFAPDIRQAIRMVREEQGPDAVIISNRRVDGGVEIVSATDYDEKLFNQFKSSSDKEEKFEAKPARADEKIKNYSNNDFIKSSVSSEKSSPGLWSEKRSDEGERLLSEVRQELKFMRSYLENQMAEISWNSFQQRSPVHAEMIKRLREFGLSQENAARLTETIRVDLDLDSAWRECLIKLVETLPVANDDIIEQGGIVALVGPTGVGKTTSVAKIAARYALRHGVRRIALLTTDDYRVGAHEQLRNYGRLLDIPVRSASTSEELQAQLNDLSDKDLVLIDTAGISQRDIRLSEQLAVIRGASSKIKVYLVLSSNIQRRGIEEAIAAFNKVPLNGCILTKLDEACSLGFALDAVIDEDLPVVYVSDGQRVPEDIHPARAENLVNQGVLLMTQQSNIKEEVKYHSAGRTQLNAH